MTRKKEANESDSDGIYKPKFDSIHANILVEFQFPMRVSFDPILAHLRLVEQKFNFALWLPLENLKKTNKK